VLEFDAWLRTRQQQYAWLAPALLARYARAYGTRLGSLLAHCRTRADLGAEVVPGLFEVELDYLRRQEWALCADDVLWRRTKLGLHVAPGAAARVDDWLQAREAERVAGRLAGPKAARTSARTAVPATPLAAAPAAATQAVAGPGRTNSA